MEWERDGVEGPESRSDIVGTTEYLRGNRIGRVSRSLT